MPKKVRRLSELGLWVANETNRRGIPLIELADTVDVTPQYLSDLMRVTMSDATTAKWREKFTEAFKAADARQTN